MHLKIVTLLGERTDDADFIEGCVGKKLVRPKESRTGIFVEPLFHARSFHIHQHTKIFEELK